ncbi:TetR family transcriptional regulator [Caballeronia sp. LZ035]|uniref:TetR/AcrR family transcriptional regulator n=1 Tax=Caballeronia sp. LZ035 TaxID=3038568 RepID=UPI00285FC957|nr:TetR family transcriptional regulator [Caballeronia sp. LZ035]MDR5763252.1 TetR family transcriptional regulator [Caballeronia sp. LZ035]
MRKSREEAAQTRQRIVETASVEFRRKGIEGAGLSEIMAAAGLTHGGFYKHFESKEQIVEESIGLAVEGLIDEVKASEATGNEPGKVFSRYLSILHRDSPGEGCPFVALGSELARSTPQIRETATEGFVKLTDAMATHYAAGSSSAAKEKALVSLSTMIGALLMARLVTDPKLSAAILSEAKKALSSE